MNTTLTTEHPAVQRAAKRLRKLPRKHHIARISEHLYEVISGRTGAYYRVDTAHLTCECEAGRLGRLCDHRIAALGFEAALTQMTRPTPTEPVAAEPDWQARKRELEASGRLVRRLDRRGRTVETTLDGWTI